MSIWRKLDGWYSRKWTTELTVENLAYSQPVCLWWLTRRFLYPLLKMLTDFLRIEPHGTYPKFCSYHQNPGIDCLMMSFQYPWRRSFSLYLYKFAHDIFYFQSLLIHLCLSFLIEKVNNSISFLTSNLKETKFNAIWFYSLKGHAHHLASEFLVLALNQ